jgi:hypothetical protein
MNSEALIWFVPVPFLGLYWYWCLYHAYPIHLERQIRAGKAWVYIPLWWKGSRKPLTMVTSVLLRIAVIISISFTAMQSITYLRNWPVMAVIFSILLTQALNWWWLPVRFQQQLKTYFNMRSAIVDNYYNSGKPYNDMEIKNLCNWEHQNRLRSHDVKGDFLRYISETSRQKAINKSELVNS